VLTARQQTSPYGVPMVSAGIPVDVGYTGHEWDEELDSFYAPYRYYNPWNARWSVPDPLGMVAGLNLYAYVKGDPLGKNDPLGLVDHECEAKCWASYSLKQVAAATARSIAKGLCVGSLPAIFLCRAAADAAYDAAMDLAFEQLGDCLKECRKNETPKECDNLCWPQPAFEICWVYRFNCWMAGKVSRTCRDPFIPGHES
jgi:RHS repeat-associated protein